MVSPQVEVHVINLDEEESDIEIELTEEDSGRTASSLGMYLYVARIKNKQRRPAKRDDIYCFNAYLYLSFFFPLPHLLLPSASPSSSPSASPSSCLSTSPSSMCLSFFFSLFLSFFFPLALLLLRFLPLLDVLLFQWSLLAFVPGDSVPFSTKGICAPFVPADSAHPSLPAESACLLCQWSPCAFCASGVRAHSVPANSAYIMC
ncbi:hypothetical protein ACLB2K_029493 [Fragaria x ananassa]